LSDGYASWVSAIRSQERTPVNARELVAEPAAVLALAEQVCPSLNGAASFRLAAALESLDAGLGLSEFGDVAEVAQALEHSRIEHWKCVLTRLPARLITVLDDEYPSNLRMVHDHPPFLFVRGSIQPGDDRAIAVVGTRKPSEEGVRAAHAIAGSLACRGVTVVSGMATGIDTAAHVGAMASGGRTLAVFGTGIERIYPASSRLLSRTIAGSGATLSQFWPDMGPTRWSFPVRNIVTSGLSLGTVVVEAGPTSGARQQAEHALRHGKRLFLLQRLVEHQPWAQDMVGRPGVVGTDDIEEIVAAVELELDLQADVLV